MGNNVNSCPYNALITTCIMKIPCERCDVYRRYRIEYQRRYRIEKREQIYEYQREWRKKNREKENQYHAKWKNKNRDKYHENAKKYSCDNPEKIRAHSFICDGIRRGKIVRPTVCSNCKIENSKIQAHHHDYNKPLDVIWVCAKCHRAIHLAADDVSHE